MNELLEKTVSCEICKCLIMKGDAQEIIVEYELGGIEPEKRYYCAQHTREYKKEKMGYYAGARYYKELEVNEEGDPIGYEKKV